MDKPMLIKVLLAFFAIAHLVYGSGNVSVAVYVAAGFIIAALEK